MADKAMEIQYQIRNNATDVREYMNDLEKWEDQVNALDQSLKAKHQENKAKQPVRAAVREESSLKRDKANIFKYYSSWDKFDADKELEKLETESSGPKYEPPKKTAEPRTKVLVKGGRTQVSEAERLKDQANLSFAGHDYEKALKQYQESLTMEPTEELKTILFSNRAECFLRLRKYHESIAEAEKALAVNSNHTKSYLRKAKAKAFLNKFNESIQDLESALSIEPENKALAQELKKVQKKRQSKINQLKESMQSKKRTPDSELTEVPVKEINSKTQTEEKKSIKEVTQKAIQKIVPESLEFPKNLIELERNWAMLSKDQSKLRNYLHKISREELGDLFARGSVESDFLMRIVEGLSLMADEAELCRSVLKSLLRSKNIGLVIKFLTKKEKEKVTQLLDSIGRQDLELFKL